MFLFLIPLTMTKTIACILKTTDHSHPLSLEGHLSLLQRAAEESDITIAPEYFLHKYLSVLDQSKKASLLERLAQISAKTNSLLIPGTFYHRIGELSFNTAFVIDRKNIILEYHKMTNGGDKRKLQFCRIRGSDPYFK